MNMLKYTIANGPVWEVPLGRRDSLTANQSLANQNLPAPTFTLDQLKSAFANQSLNTTDLVVLSGAHTVGRAKCSTFIQRLYNFNSTGNPDTTLNATLLQSLQAICPNGGPGTNLTNLDLTTPDTFDSNYYSNLQLQNGLLQTDQELFKTSGADTIPIVNSFSSNQTLFFENFKASMIKMGNIGVLTGSQGEIRTQCNFVNGNSSGLATPATKESSQDGMGCDASILLNNTATIVSEQQALPNINSIRGLDVINQIKTELESACPGIVSCADILTLAAQVSSLLAHGPYWKVPLGRRDSLTANQTLANQNLPAPFFNLTLLKAAFAAQGLDTVDLVALSGAHTFGRSHCSLFANRLYNFSGTGKPDPTLDTSYLQQLRKICPNGGPNNLANFDPTTPDTLDNNYYSNLQVKKGLLQSDQELFSTPGADTISIVNKFSSNQHDFFKNFKNSMIKMGNIGVLTGKKGEIRKHCNFVNKKSAEVDTASVASEESLEEGVGSSQVIIQSTRKMSSLSFFTVKVALFMLIAASLPFSDAQLDNSFYKDTCPKVHSIVREVIRNVSKSDPRILASLIRLHFHDCFVQGCDASILLNDTATIVSEQTAAPNNNSIRGLDVVNQIKTAVENACPGIVSCADILALAAEISSVLIFCYKY
ncbi:Peroxidase 15, partial [Mucuna pruriens]